MSSSTYWRDRELEWKKKRLKDERQYADEIQEIYANMMDSVEKEIESFFSRYASKEGITMSEAKKRVSNIEIEAYQRKAKKYVKEKNFSDEANEQMRLYNLAMKVNRLELLKANIGLELVAGHDELKSYTGDKLEGAYLEEIKRNASILGDTVIDNAKMAKTVADSSFKNATFSERIWVNQDQLKNSLSSVLSNALIQGKNPREFIPQIRKKFDVSRCNAERLLRTEIARVQTQAQTESYESNGIDEYEYIACSLKDVCSLCKEMDGKTFKLKEMEIGINAPPMHPNCHCATAPHSDRKEYEKWLNGLANGEHSLRFDEWKQKQSEKSNYNDSIVNSESVVKKKRVYKVKPINTAEEIQPYFDKLHFLSIDKSLKNYIKNELRYIPKSDLEILKRRPVYIRKTKNNSNYRGSGMSNLISINTCYNPGSFAHEFAHYVVEKTKFNEGLLDCLENVFNSGILVYEGHYKNGYYIEVKSDKFVRPYQGRTYYSSDKLKDNTFQIKPTDLLEYVSVGYEQYIIDPWDLLEKDEMLYNYFDRGGLFE